MKNRFIGLLAKLKLAVALTLLIAVGSVSAQEFPQGLIGLSSTDLGALYTINPNTGRATLFVTTDGETSIVGLSYIEGTLYGSDIEDYPGSPIPDDFTVGSIATDGTVTFISNQNESSNWWGLASDDCGGNVLYSMDSDNSNILTALLPNGTVQTIGTGSDIGFGGMAYDDENEILYGLSDQDEGMNLYRISTTTGDLTLVGPIGDFEATLNTSLAYDEINQILYANFSGALYTLNVNTGAATLVGQNNADDETIDGLAWLDPCGPPPPDVQVPTLSEWCLIAMAGVLGVVGFMVMRRKRVAA